MTEGEANSVVRRIDRERAVTVTADVDPFTSPESVTAAMGPALEQIRAKHPTVNIDIGGRQQDVYDAFESLPVAMFAACVMIYVILAWLFGSYLQPFAVMLAIPFSLIGVVWGHWLLGFDLTFLSLIGVVALAGVVVNNSLILVEFLNRNRRAGMPLQEALVDDTEQAVMFKQLDEAFHNALFAAVNQANLHGHIPARCGHLARLRTLDLPREEKMESLLEGHRAILDAIETGDGDHAARVMRKHLSGSLERLPEIRAENEALFS